MYYPPKLAFHNSDKFRIVQYLVSEAYMYYPVPSVPYYLLNFNFNNLIRVGGWGGGYTYYHLFGIISRKREGLSLEL